MIRHILLFKFHDDVPESVRGNAIERLESLGERCSTVASWSIGVNYAGSPSAYDVAEVADFASPADLTEYKDHPAHLEFAEHMGMLSTWTLVDYEFTPGT